MKRILALLVVMMLILNVVGCTTDKPKETDGEKGAGEDAAKSDITIGVSIWSSTDTLGSQVKEMIDSAAEALDVKVMYVDQGHVSEEVIDSVETLVAAGCDGIIICNSSSAEMTSVINTASEHKAYVAQFFRNIDEQDNPQEFELAQSSPYYVGTVHEDEVANGHNLAYTLCERGYREIALQGWEAGDSTFLARWEGYKSGVEAWNKDYPEDQAVLLEPQYGGTTSDTGRATAEAIISGNSKVDAIIVSGGGGDPLIGAISAIEGLGRTGEIGVASTDFLHDLDEQLKRNAITVESGGHFADPLYAFLMVYNAITGDYEVPTDDFYEILFPYLYVSSSEEYELFEKYFIEDLPYSQEEIKEMSGYDFEKLKTTAESLSIDEVVERHGEK